MKFEIKSRWNGSVIFSLECESLRVCVEAAVKSGADLSGADLIRANLRRADLSDANLSGADLSGADLSGADLIRANLRRADLSGANLSDANLSGADLIRADLSGADLSGANLSGADLSGANLSDANLSGADLSGADLSGADLSGANLSGADLSGANLSGANLLPIRDDIWAVLSSIPAEVQGVIDAIKNGQIDGSVYEGECACLVGTAAKVRKCSPHDLGSLKPNYSRPAERFFLGIKKGDTPETNQFSKLALEWCEEWLANMRAAFGAA